MYRRPILDRAFKSIPPELLPFVVAHDHAIIYLEAWKVSQKVGLLRNAVHHCEPDTLFRLLKKNFIYGKSAKRLARSGHYGELLVSKIGFRRGRWNGESFSLGVQSGLLAILKGIPFALGFALDGD